MANRRKAAREDLRGLLFPSASVPSPGPQVRTPAAHLSHPMSASTNRLEAQRDLTLGEMLTQHLEFYKFSQADTEHVPVLVHQLKTNPLAQSAHADWVVLHQQGPTFASITSKEELKRVAKPGDTPLSAPLLAFLAHHPVPEHLLYAWRTSAEELFRPCSDLLTLQALTVPVWKRSLTHTVPLTLMHSFAGLVQARYDQAHRPLSLTLKQARVLELLGATWTQGQDDAEALKQATRIVWA